MVSEINRGRINKKKFVNEYLIKLNEFKFDFSLKRIKACIKLLNNPQNSYQVIHVAGSNGKGLVCAYLANIFREHGYKTGLYASPHLKDITERISVDGKPVVGELFYNEAIKLKNLIEKKKIKLTYFEFLTALAFVIFKKQKIDIAIIETGLGGRLDATNVGYKRKLLSVITSIALEHTDWLGKTEMSILNEKEQIIGSGWCVSGIKQADLRVHLAKKFRERIFFNDTFYSMSMGERVNNVLSVDYKDIPNNIIISLKTKMTESIQAENIRTVLSCLKVLEKSGFKFDVQKVRGAIYKTVLPGRLSYSKKGYYISVAHNYEAIDEMLASLKDISKNRKIVYVFSVLKDKDMDAIARVIKKYKKLAVIITQIHNNTRALSIGKIRDYIVKYKIRYSMEPDNKAAMRKAMKIKGNGVVVVGGSFYLAKEYL